jgi:hypothetical protein
MALQFAVTLVVVGNYTVARCRVGVFTGTSLVKKNTTVDARDFRCSLYLMPKSTRWRFCYLLLSIG